MKFTVGQKAFLVGTVGFFSLHFVFHHVDLGRAFGLYKTLTVLAILPIAFNVLTLSIAWRLAKTDDLRLDRGRWALTFVLMLVVALSVRVCSSFDCHGLPAAYLQRRFDREVWARGIPGYGSQRTERQKMLGDVLDTVVAGGTRDRVIEALGPTEDASWEDESDCRMVSYCLGPERESLLGIGFDGEVLVIRFDECGNVSNWYSFTD